MKGLLCFLAIVGTVTCDLSDLRKFRSSQEQTRNLNKASRKIETYDYVDEFYDYFNIDPFENTNTNRRTDDEPSVADDVLKSVKRPKRPASKYNRKSTRYPYKKRHHDDNIAMPSKPNVKVVERRTNRPTKTKKIVKKQDTLKMPSFAALTSKIERLVPSKLKTVIEGEGKKIVKTVLQPVKKMSHEIKDTLVDRDGSDSMKIVQSKVQTWLSPYRSYLDVYSDMFNSDFVVRQMVGLWVNCFAGTMAWMALGAIETTVNGRSFDSDGRSAKVPMPWDEFTPDSDTMSMVFEGLADVAARWHDEL